MARGTMILGVLLCSLCLAVRGDDVVELTPSNFNQEVIQSDGLWFVEFFAPWCGHCQSLAPQWKKAATALKGIVSLGAVDADKHQSLGSQYEIRGFPTIKIFGANKNKPENYQGGRTAEAIVDAALNALRSLALDRLNGRGGGQDHGRQQEIGEEEPPKRRSGKKKGGKRNKNKGGRKRQESCE